MATNSKLWLLPHILLPLVQIFSLAVPPFRFRAIVFISLILYLVIQTWRNIETNDVETTTLLLAQWPWYLGTIEKLAFHNAEEDFHKLGTPPSEALAMKLPQKLAWSTAMYCSPRGINWNYQVQGVPKHQATHSKVAFILDQMKWLIVCALMGDVLAFYSRVYYYGSGIDPVDLTSYSSNWVRSFVNAVHALFTPYFGLNFAYCQLSMICVALRLGDPQDWPPLYGRIHEATTLRRFWNTWWHQCVRRVFKSYSRAFASFLRLRRGSFLSRYVQLYLVFILSATGHAFVIYGLPHSPRHTIWDRFWSFWLCFALQACAIQVEDAVIWIYENWPLQKDVSRTRKVNSWWHRLVGWIWVVAWHWAVAVIMTDPGLKLGVLASKPLPFSPIETILDSVGMRRFVEDKIGRYSP